MLHKRISQILFLGFLVFPVIIPAGILSMFTILVLILFLINPLGNKNNFNFIKFIWPLFIIIFTGFHGFIYHSPYNSLKDIWYITNPIATMLMGYFLMIYIDNFKSLMKIIILAAVLVAIFHISKFIISPDLLQKSYIEIRSSSAGRGYFIVVIGLTILITNWKKFSSENYFTNKYLPISITIILGLSFILSFSRTLILVFILFFFSLRGVIGKHNKKQKIYLFSLALIIIISFFTDISLNQLTMRYDGTFVAKLVRSWNEISISNYSSLDDINMNWRGYESYRGIQAYQAGNVFNIIAGRGIGYLTDIGISIKLGGDQYYRLIPIFHNGYIYLLIKSGLLGLFAYLIFLFRIFTFANSMDQGNDLEISMSARICVGLTIIILATTAIMAGFFNKSSLAPVLLITGACISHLNTHKKINGL
ncbi:MAG: hypothetical protein KKE62_04600 [Proteobacteria bacterium]|nr:hypothetical protein [Pseudomonadota bacterium]MBU1388042.1 hypothetical protein [Pseudomonadota bacterium]MBU1542105.1 hypothetical protein [Pseudomonadota bacterium]